MAGASQVTSTESSPFNTCCTLRGALVSRIKEITSAVNYKFNEVDSHIMPFTVKTANVIKTNFTDSVSNNGFRQVQSVNTS